MKIFLVVPTYNECDNIKPLVQALQNVFRKMSHDMNILVADDRSPDGTGDMVREMMGHYKNLYLIEGKKEGLGTAYTRGIKHAVNEFKADVVIEMDADFSHNPEDVPGLIREIENGSDFVIGSRYIKGGTIPKNWGLYRQVVSRSGNFAARHITGIGNVKDCTSGFRAITKEIINKIDWAAVQVQGYAFQVALLHAAIVSGAKVKEIPIQFRDRKYGESKLGLSDIMEFALNAWWIRYRMQATFIKFAIVGISGVFVNIGFFSIFILAGINKFIASPMAIEISIISNFLLNNFWTFHLRKMKAGLKVKMLKFHAVSLLSLGVSYLTFIVLVLLFPEWPLYIAQTLGIPPAMFVNYSLNSKWTFNQLDT